MIGISVIKELPGSFVFFCPVNASGNSIFDFLRVNIYLRVSALQKSLLNVEKNVRKRDIRLDS